MLTAGLEGVSVPAQSSPADSIARVFVSVWVGGVSFVGLGMEVVFCLSNIRGYGNQGLSCDTVVKKLSASTVENFTEFTSARISAWDGTG